MKNIRSNRVGMQCETGTVCRMATVLFSCMVALSNGATNWVSGTAYGTDYTALATAGSISSISNASGSLIIGHGGTTNLTLMNNQKIGGFISITNEYSGFTVNATGSSVSNSQGYVFSALNATNITINGGRFVGQAGSGGTLPPFPGEDYMTGSALGGFISNSTATIVGSTFIGADDKDGLVVDRSVVTISNGVFRSTGSGSGLYADNGSTISVHDGSFTGGVGNTAFFLRDSSVTIENGTFIGNVNGTTEVAGDGLFSILSGATTNTVELNGGTFSSLAFYGTTGSVQNVVAGSGITVQKGIIQSGGTVILDNQNNTALNNIEIYNGSMDLLNAFTLNSGGTFSLFGSQSVVNFADLLIETNATANVGSGMLTANNLTVESGGNLSFQIYNGSNGTASASSATFNTGSKILVDATFSGFSGGNTNNITLLTTGGLSLGDGTNQVETTVAGRSELIDISTAGDELTLKFSTAALVDYWGATGVMADLANELDLINNNAMMANIDFIDNPGRSSAAIEQTYLTTFNTFQSALNSLDAAAGQSASRGIEFREQLKLPAGPQGPTINNDIRAWGKYYGQFYSHDSDGLNAEYDSTLHGGVFGVDKSFGKLLLGISGGAGRSTSTLDNDAEEDINTYHGALYSTYGAERLYLDGGVAYGHNRVTGETAVPFVLKSEYDASLISAYLGGGYNLVDTKGGTVITPEVSVQYSTYEQDAYTETSSVAVPRSFDAFDADSLRSKLGVNLAMLNNKVMKTVAFKVEGRFHWLHEFNPDPGNLNFVLEGGSGADFQISHPQLDEDMFRAGVSVTFFNTKREQPKNVLFRLDLDEFFGEDFISHNLGAKVVYAF